MLDIQTNDVGKLCPLCQKGIIAYFKIKDGLFGKEIEFTMCTNEGCNAHGDINKFLL